MKKHILATSLLFIACTVQAQNKGTTEFTKSPLLESTVDTLGVTYKNERMTTDYYGSLNNIDSISKEGKWISIKETKSHYAYYGFKLNYASFIDIASVGRLPKLQSKYAQGMGNNWAGGQYTSWGPNINTLEYIGTPYDYDKNGSLVALGSGNRILAKTYDATDFFRSGIAFGNSVDVKFPGLFHRGISSISIGQKRINSPIPNSYKESYNASFLMERIKTGRFVSNFGIIYQKTDGKLVEQGANMATLMHAVFTTPPTFDNSNGLSRKQATNGTEAWLLSNGKERSYSPQYVNNPFMLINSLPDKDKSDNLVAYARTNYSFDKIKVDASLSFDKRWNKRYNGIMNDPINYNVYRNERESNLSGSSNFSYNVKNDDTKNFLIAKYGFKKTVNKLNRENKLNVSGSDLSSASIDKKMDRTAHDIKYGMKLEDYNEYLNLEVYNKHYFSNTIKSNKYINLFPEARINWKMDEFIEDTFDKYDKHFTIYASFDRSIGEASLVYNNYAALSTQIEAEDFRNYFEYVDIFHYKNLKPETYLKNEFGLKYQTHNNKFNAEANSFYYTTQNFISPVFNGASQTPTLQNIGRIKNYGYFISATYRNNGQSHKQLGYEIQLNFSQSRNKVTALYGDESFVRLGGFSDIATVFAKNETLGAIYGTTYQRNDKGQLVIGRDGFPLVDKDLKKIGDPTPDFTITLNPSLYWKNFALNIGLEYSHGGDRWNGTRAFLDYQGMSAESADKREIKGYIFDGVDINGNTNTVAVDFYNPNMSLLTNKWVRYGAAGVGEEYIEKATYFRVADISLSYKIPIKESSIFKSMKIGAKAQNVLLITGYKGVDPSSSLFGYSSSKGLDLFNLPSNRNYSFFFTFEL